jgi:hypothetical protein
MMGRKKRSQVQAAQTSAVAVQERRAAPTATVISAFCPCCGKSIAEGRAVKVGNITVGKTPYFETIEWDPNKPFGVSQPAGGRGSFREFQPIGPEDAPELFEAVKKRLIDAVGEWKAKGWLTEEDVLKSIRR